MVRPVYVLLLGLVIASTETLAQAQLAQVLTSEELRQVMSLGPWPPARRPDPGNRVSGHAQAVELGRRLFGDPRMSSVGYIACVTCHQPDRAFTDIKARAHGLADLPRNTPALANLDQQHWFGWGGSSDSLWMASIRPILDAREIDGSLASITRLFERDAELAACYRRVFQVSPLRRPERTAVNVGKALAAFQETLVTGRTIFDDFRDALMRNDGAGAASYPAAALRGLRLFVGAARCVACHRGANFSDGGFHRIMSPGLADRRGAADEDSDTGRLEGARSLKASRLNLLSSYNDAPRRSNASATQRLMVSEGLRGQYRTPSLRNVAVTGPYLHDGRVDRLQDALQHFAAAPSSHALQPPVSLSTTQVEDLTAFLVTLTDRHGGRRPWTSANLSSCP